MSKRNIAYVKPQDPSFLRKLKQEIGYEEGPTVDTKRKKLKASTSDGSGDSDSNNEGEDEKPQVVVLKAGDLTAEEADAEKKRIEKEENEKPADLNQRIIFKGKTKVTEVLEATKSASKSADKKSKKKESKSKLSFNQDDDEEEEH